ncbi:MAG TPA: sigma-70 family RNA polymerase sigma factor [Kofleriaceae bacterium]|nr:sigma-70 family RNA polymerase sigma factor [Kofleriaceae bacterium]
MDEAALVRELAPRARLYGLRHLRSEAAADDLAQTAMVVMIESLRAGKIREVERLPSFVLGTCRMIAMEWKRGEGRRRNLREVFGEDLAPAPVRAASTVDDLRLGACLDGLAAKPRTIVMLTFYEELDADQIARQLGMAAGAVRVARHRALAQLAVCMGAGEVAT